MTEIKYKVSTRKSKFGGYHSTSKGKSTITAYIQNLRYEDSFEYFVHNLIYIFIVERIYLERGFQRIRMKNRCSPCKMDKYADEMMYYI